ncbi:MAG: hypothetical protein V1921_03000 [Candidatus Altiarchaeota archaeon]
MTSMVSAEIRIDSVSFDPAQIQSGDEATIYVKMHDSLIGRDLWSGQTTGYSDKGVVQENPDLFYYAKLIPKDDIAKEYITIIDGEKRIGHLSPGESWTTPLRVKVDGNAPAADYKMDFQVIQRNAKTLADEIARSYQFNITVKGIIKLNLQSGDTLDLGAVNDLWVSITNEGGGTARHVSMKLDVNNSFTTLQSSEAYVGSISGGVQRNVTFKIAVDNDATPGAYNIPVTLEYVNESGSAQKLNKTIGVRVEGEPTIRVSLDGDEKYTEGGANTVTINVINEGFVDVKFLDVRILASEDYIVESADSSYIGTLSSDDFDSEDFTLRFTKEGIVPVNIRIMFKDQYSDKSYERTEQVNVHVLSKSEYAALQQENGGSSVLGKLLILPGLFVAYLVLWFLYKIMGRITEWLNRRFFKKA